MRGRIGASRPGGAASARTARVSAAVLCTVGLAFAAFATPASAVTNGHIFGFAFGEQGTGAGQFEAGYAGFDVAVDDSTGDVYVADSENSRVQKFDENGNFLMMWGFGVRDGSDEFQVCEAPGPCQKGIYGNAPKQFRFPGGIAVDNSSGPNKGDVYVADVGCWCGEGRNEILKFSPNGAYLGSINGEETPGGVFHGLSPYNLDVDGNGFVWVAENERIMRFSNQANNAYVGGSEWHVWATSQYTGGPEAIPAFNIAATPDGSAVYVTSYYLGGPWWQDALYRFVANGSTQRFVMANRGGMTAFDSSNDHFFAANIYPGNGDCPPQSQEFDGDPVEPKPVGPPFSWEGFSCGVASLAVNPNTGVVYAAGNFVPKIAAFVPRRVPETITEPATLVLHTTATINGHTAPDPIAGGPVSECYFEWGLTTTYEHKTPCEQEAPISGPTDVTLALSGLIQDETYHYRLVARNSIDVEHGEDRTFTPAAVLELNTGEASDITATTANLHGSFNANGEGTEYFFEWGDAKSDLSHVTPAKDGGAGGPTSASQSLEGLEQYKQYYYRISATNSFGTSHGATLSFKTNPASPPKVAESSATEVTDKTARLKADIMPEYGATLYGFEYGETVAYGTQVLGEDLLEADAQEHRVEVGIQGLTPGHTYHFRVIAINFGGITYGPDEELTTLDVPSVISSEASSVTAASAQLNALVNPSLSSTVVHFEYGPSTAYGAGTPVRSIGGGSKAVATSIGIGGLSPDATYHFRAVASNAIGSTAGPDQTFTTVAAGSSPPPPPPKRCKRGFVRRHGRCVRRRHPKHRHTTRGHRRSAE